MKPDVICRWASWNPTIEGCYMLSHSIGSFQRFLGSTAEYVVYADDPEFVTAHLLVEAEVRQLDGSPRSRYIRPEATWRKWAPMPRVDAGRAELRIDSDIFLLAEPVELRRFLAHGGPSYLVSSEEFVALWPYGNFGGKLPSRFLPINAGLVGQAPGCDLTPLLDAEFDWWEESIAPDEVKYHDEQGAVAVVMQALAAEGEVTVLDPARYRIVCPLNRPPVRDVTGLVMLHATYPEHPAFWQFLPEIAQMSGITADPAEVGLTLRRHVS
ncbi:hypothetical protein GBF35_30320 [Nonomuraea phyllanthi]|uniref:hypothetical protein n=1 Tax=Nonomuraea phyllanthi TaxID=2219224 RepID=UPI00129387B2|nr:hypothetical protein [Nonomuraea phyllanthi]QFY10344.1 hypothetical protein GBF35_30320 [Nonomuraea phyllanthi]